MRNNACVTKVPGQRLSNIQGSRLLQSLKHYCSTNYMIGDEAAIQAMQANECYSCWTELTEQK
jgi:hypothetical protein